jgi:phosphosulfolactate phosphohydrolase-like enzyme
VLSTTNGTRKIEAARGAVKILAIAFVNARTVADELRLRLRRAGRGDRMRLGGPPGVRG